MGLEEYNKQEAMKRAQRRKNKRLKDINERIMVNPDSGLSNRDLRALGLFEKSEDIVKSICDSINITVKELLKKNKTPIQIKKVVEKQASQMLMSINDSSNCKEVTEIIQKNDRKKSSLGTFKKHMASLKNMYRNMGLGTWNCRDFEWLKDKKAVLKHIENIPLSDNTKVSRLKAIAAVLRSIPDMAELQLFYSKIQTQKNNLIMDSKAKNLVGNSEADEEGFIWDINEIKSAVGQAKIQNDTQGALLLALNSYIPPRRVLDYQHCIVFKEGNSRPNFNDPDKNYILFDKKCKFKKLIINLQKNSKRNDRRRAKQYTRTKINAVVLRKLLTKRCKEVKNGDYLFSKSKNNKKPISQMTGYIKDTFEKYTKKTVTQNISRSIYASHILNNKSYSGKKIEEVAYNMGTSASRLINVYRKLRRKDIDNADDYEVSDNDYDSDSDYTT